MLRIRRFILCLAAVTSMLAGGNVYAGGGLSRLSDNESYIESASGSGKRTEAAEKPDFLPAEIKAEYAFSGSAEGVDLYISDSKAAAIFTESGDAAAEFKRLCMEDGIVRYVSGSGCYIADVDEVSGRLRTVRRLISSLDSEIAYLTDNGRQLDLMDSSKKVCETSLFYSGESDGMRVYKNSETGEFAWLSADMKQYYGTFVSCAENEKLRLFADTRTTLIGLENKETGYIWWSSPLEAGRDQKVNDTLAGELRSSTVLSYGIPEKRSDNNTLRSGVSSDCNVSAELIGDGLRVVYDFKKSGFRYPIEYTLGSDYLRASLKVADIEETTQGRIATRVNLLGSFGAASEGEEGCFVIPDGSGAIVRFESKKSENAAPYLSRVYGNDVTAVPAARGAASEQIYLPMYGIVKDGNALLAVADKGDSNALLSVKTSEQSNTSYDLCSFVFTLRSTDTYHLSGTSSTSFTVFEKGGIKSDDIEMRYYPLSGENADHTDIAARYREYLIEEKGVAKRAEDSSSPLYLGLYGGVMKKRSLLGIPVDMRTAVTTYGQARDIVESLNVNGVDDMVVTYTNWTDRGMKNQVDTKAKPSGTLGGKEKFSEFCGYLDENSFPLYPVSDNRDFVSGGGYYSFTDTAVRISGAYSRIVSYDLAYGIPDGFAKNRSLLSPEYFGKVLGKASDSYGKRGLDGISLSSLTTSLYGDYGKRDISRYTAMNMLTEAYSGLDSNLSDGILADGANAYALPYVSRIANVPMTSSRYDMFDEDIPLYQLVMHGLIPYSAKAFNASPDPVQSILMAAATGSSLSCDMLWEDVSEFTDTEFSIYYYANYKGSMKRAAEAYRTVSPLLAKVSGCNITDYSVTDDGNRITTVYSDGTAITVDLEKQTIESGGVLYELGSLGREVGA